MKLRTKIGMVFLLVVGIFLSQAILKPVIGDTASKICYLTLDSTAVNLGADGRTNTSQP